MKCRYAICGVSNLLAKIYVKTTIVGHSADFQIGLIAYLILIHLADAYINFMNWKSYPDGLISGLQIFVAGNN